MKTVLFSIAMLGLLATPVLAQDTPEQPAKEGRKHQRKQERKHTLAEHFERMDADKDGKISKEEAKGRIADKFADVDANGDGFVTKEEAKAYLKANMSERRAKHKERREGRRERKAE